MPQHPVGMQTVVVRAMRVLPKYAQTCEPTVIGRVCVELYRWRLFRPLVRKVLSRAEGGVIFSPSWRIIAHNYHKVDFGRFSYIANGTPAMLPPGTRVGNFCSIAEGLIVLRRNHPIDYLSQHPLFYRKELGLTDHDRLGPLESNPLVIGHDVWIGSRVIVLPACRCIGNGAIVAAGAVLTEDVAPFTIVGGVPARPIRKRFSLAIEQAVVAAEWWLAPIEKIAMYRDLFSEPLTEDRLAELGMAFPPTNCCV